MTEDPTQGTHPSPHTDTDDHANPARLATLNRPREHPQHTHPRLKKQPNRLAGPTAAT